MPSSFPCSLRVAVSSSSIYSTISFVTSGDLTAAWGDSAALLAGRGDLCDSVILKASRFPSVVVLGVACSSAGISPYSICTLRSISLTVLVTPLFLISLLSFLSVNISSSFLTWYTLFLSSCSTACFENFSIYLRTLSLYFASSSALCSFFFRGRVPYLSTLSGSISLILNMVLWSW